MPKVYPIKALFEGCLKSRKMKQVIQAVQKLKPGKSSCDCMVPKLTFFVKFEGLLGIILNPQFVALVCGAGYTGLHCPDGWPRSIISIRLVPPLCPAEGP